MKLLCLVAAAQSCTAWQAPVHSALRRTPPPIMMARWTQEDMKAKSIPLPAEVEVLLSDDTDRPTTQKLYAALRACFKSEEEAIAAAERNPSASATLPCAIASCRPLPSAITNAATSRQRAHVSFTVVKWPLP